MSALNPERVFRIHIPLDRLLAAWHARAAPRPIWPPTPASSTPPTPSCPAA